MHSNITHTVRQCSEYLGPERTAKILDAVRSRQSQANEVDECLKNPAVSHLRHQLLSTLFLDAFLTLDRVLELIITNYSPPREDGTDQTLMWEEAKRITGIGKSFEEFWGFSREALHPDRLDSPQLPEELEAMLKTSANKRVVAELRWRMASEARRAYQEGWFIVFDTLTIDPKRYVRTVDFWTQPHWLDYRKKVKELVGQASYPDITTRHLEKVSTSDYLTYCAVLEGGNANPHCHIIWFMKNIPDSWRFDPNRGLVATRSALVYPMKALWPCGWSLPKAFRMAKDDGWGRIGWSWPGALVPQGPASVGSYLLKYVTKELSCRNTYKAGEISLRRVRRSTKLGERELDEVMNHMTLEELSFLSQEPPDGLPLVLRAPSPGLIVPPMRLLRQKLRDVTFSKALDSTPVSTLISYYMRRARKNLFAILDLLPELTSTELRTWFASRAQFCEGLDFSDSLRSFRLRFGVPLWFRPKTRYVKVA